MGQTPDARLYYGLMYKKDEIPQNLRDVDDPDDVVALALGISHLPFSQRMNRFREEKPGWSAAFLGDRRQVLAFCAFGKVQSSWGWTEFEMPSEEEIEAREMKARAAAAKLGLPDADTRPFSWCLEADFG